MSRFKDRGFITRWWWASAPSVPGTPGDPPVDPENTAPVVANPIPDQQATEGQLFEFTFASDAFTDADLDPLTYSATLAGGSPLPAWLTFTPATRTFSGTPPSEVTMSIRVTANDGNGGSISDTFVLTVEAAATDVPTLTVTDGGDLVTASYQPLLNERNKPPVIEDVEISGTLEVGEVLTATITGHVNGPFEEGTHEYQWYRVDDIDGVLVAISGATESTYTLQQEDYEKHITVRARFNQQGGANNTSSDWMYAILTDLVAAESTGGGGGEGDLEYAWADFFDVEFGESIPSNWNDSLVDPVLINIGSGNDWSAEDIDKPPFEVDKLTFSDGHRIEGNSASHPPVFELWIKARFTAPGALLCMGNATLFGMNSSGDFISGNNFLAEGDTQEHVFRLVLNGANSIFQMDGGNIVTFTEDIGFGSKLILGQTNSGGNTGDFELKRLQRTPDGQTLTTQEVITKWDYHGFVHDPGDGGGDGGDGGDGGGGETLATLSFADGGDLVTADYEPLVDELNKPPTIEEVEITGVLEVGETLTAVITGHVNGPFAVGTHEYQWYRADTIDGALTEIAGATSSTYLVDAADLGQYLTVRARYVQSGGVNTTSEYMYSILTDVIEAGSGGGGGGDDIDYAWFDEFNIESGESVSPTWNTDVNPPLVNLGSGDNWDTEDIDKPILNGDQLEFTAASSHRVDSPGSYAAHPPVFEVWIKGSFNDLNGTVFSMGSNTLLGSNSSGEFYSNGMATTIPGDLNEHVFRVVLNGANSFLQIDNGTPVAFTDSNGFATRFAIGIKVSGSNPASFNLKLFQRTPDGQLLTPQEAADKWAYHGF